MRRSCDRRKLLKHFHLTEVMLAVVRGFIKVDASGLGKSIKSPHSNQKQVRRIDLNPIGLSESLVEQVKTSAEAINEILTVGAAGGFVAQASKANHTNQQERAK